VTVKGAQAVGLRDPLRLSGHMLCVPPAALYVIQMLDGARSLLEIQREMSRRPGEAVRLDDIVAIVNALHDSFLLDDSAFRSAYARRVEAYRAQEFRPAAHAGAAYSDEPAELTTQLSGFFSEDGGPGAPVFSNHAERPKGLIAPHIDIRAGGASFAKAYHALAAGPPSDVYVVFGTGHAGVEGLFTATRLDFETPLGRVRVDREFVDRISDSLGRDAAEEEILHGGEHVIEFQAVFLQHLFQDRHDFQIAPILVALSPHYFHDPVTFSDEMRVIDEFCGAVKHAAAESGKSVCYIASADLDHIGPRYGDRFIPDDGVLDKALARDRRLLAALETLDMDAFVRDVAAEQDQARICGFSPISAMLKCMEAERGHTLALDYATVDDNRSFVTFASMIFY
jgi:AmmeMemoRadiSam system protein B